MDMVGQTCKGHLLLLLLCQVLAIIVVNCQACANSTEILVKNVQKLGVKESFQKRVKLFDGAQICLKTASGGYSFPNGF